MKQSTKNFIEGIVTGRGIQYTPALLPKGIERGKPGDCFDWCMVQAIKNPTYRYVEGLAQNPKNRDDWVYHAWLTDGTHAFDPTWQATHGLTEYPVPSIYIGIEFDIKEVAQFVHQTEFKAILANHWRAPELFESMRKGALRV